MGYAVYEDWDARDRGVTRWAGYGVPAICDMPGCDEEIDRGLGCKCERCGLFFCGEHLYLTCPDTHNGLTPKPDTAEWERHMLTDESWQQWRDENPGLVDALLGGAK